MRFGTPWSSGLGSPDNFIQWQNATVNAEGTNFLYQFVPSPRMGDAWFGLYVDGRLVRTVFAPEGGLVKVTLPVPAGSDSLSYMALRHGHSGDQTYAAVAALASYEAVEGQRISLKAFWPYEVVVDSGDEGNYLSNWVLEGLIAGDNVPPDTIYPTRGDLTATLAVSGGTAGIVVYSNGSEIASGSAVLSGATTVTLTESNFSGVSGSVLVQAAATSDSDIGLKVRWAGSMRVLRDQTDPPTTVVDTIPFDNRPIFHWSEATGLAAGTYYYRLQPVSDTNVAGTATASLSWTIVSTPQAPSGFSGFSGTKDNFFIGFQGNPGFSHRLYASDIDGVIDLVTPRDVVGLGTSFFSNVAFTGFSGQAYVLVRGFSGAVESRNSSVLALEFDQFSAFVPPRPNKAGIVPGSIEVTGLDVTLVANYISSQELATPTSINFYVRAEQDAYDYNTIADTVALDAAGSSLSAAVRRASGSFSVASAGLYYVTARAVTSAGTLSEVGSEVEFVASDAVMAAPSGWSGQVGRRQ